MTTNILQEETMIPVEEIPAMFNDLSPVSQNETNRVCVINYPPAFKVAYNYMRAVWTANEFSRRAMKLSATCLKMNPANYTVWNYRRRCFQSLGFTSDKVSVKNELDLASSLGGNNPKNYQVWYHRRALLEMYGPREFYDEEIRYINNVLVIDSKNYHAWSYRQWILMSIDEESVWKNEMKSVCDLIQNDVHNNSAWNQRWFVSHRGKQWQQQQQQQQRQPEQLQPPPIGLDVARQEADFALNHGVIIDPYNESPWRYLIGILREQHEYFQRQREQQQYEEDKEEEPIDGESVLKRIIVEYEAKMRSNEIRNILIDANCDPDTCIHMNNARIELLEMIDTGKSLQQAIALAGALGTMLDVIRKKYWLLVLKRLKGRYISKKDLIVIGSVTV